MEEEIRPKIKTKKSPTKLVLNLLIYVLIVGGIVFGLPRFLTWKLQTDYPMAAITSGSMWPVLKEGDLVFIRGVKEKSQIQIGDIIVFKNRVNNNLTIHRVIKMNEDDLVTKGDANFNEDAPTVYGDVVGKTFNIKEKPLRIPLLGSVTVFASSFRGSK
jgi:signal peptidase I